MELTDGVITVRSPIEDDAEAVVDAVQSSLAEIGPWLPFATSDYGLKDALEWIRGDVDPGHPAVIIAPDGALVGTTGINLVNDVNKFANLGYWVRADATGNGWASRAARLVARHGIEKLGLHRIEIMMAVDNEASRRVAEKAGARYEGILRGRLLLHGVFHDTHVFSVLPGDLD